MVLNMAQAQLTARKMSSILGQNCSAELRVSTFPIQVTDISCPLLSPSLHTSLLTSFPHSFAYFCHPSLSLSYKGRLYHISHLPRKQSASTPNQRRFVISRSVCGFAVLCVCFFNIYNIYCILVPFCRYVQISRYRFCACMRVYVRKECVVRRKREL